MPVHVSPKVFIHLWVWKCKTGGSHRSYKNLLGHMYTFDTYTYGHTYLTLFHLTVCLKEHVQSQQIIPHQDVLGSLVRSYLLRLHKQRCAQCM